MSRDLLQLFFFINLLTASLGNLGDSFNACGRNKSTALLHQRPFCNVKPDATIIQAYRRILLYPKNPKEFPSPLGSLQLCREKSRSSNHKMSNSFYFYGSFLPSPWIRTTAPIESGVNSNPDSKLCFVFIMR